MPLPSKFGFSMPYKPDKPSGMDFSYTGGNAFSVPKFQPKSAKSNQIPSAPKKGGEFGVTKPVKPAVKHSNTQTGKHSNKPAVKHSNKPAVKKPNPLDPDALDDGTRNDLGQITSDENSNAVGYSASRVGRLTNPHSEFLSLDTIRKMHPIRSYHHSIEIELKMHTTDGAKVLSTNIPPARVKNFSPSGLILGYGIEAIGSFSMGSPEWVLVNKNGLNFQDMSFEIEEFGDAQLPILRTLMSTFMLQANDGLTFGVSSRGKWGGFEIIVRTWGMVSSKGLVEVRRYIIGGNVILGVDVPALTTTSNEFIKYSLTVSPNSVRIVDSYEKNLAILESSVTEIKSEPEPVDEESAGNVMETKGSKKVPFEFPELL